MQEAEVSLRLAMYHIENNLTKDEVQVSIDGAHIKTKDTIHFDIWNFFKDHGFIKLDKEVNKWQGLYQYKDYQPKIRIFSRPGFGDVKVNLMTGKTLYVESKKGKKNKVGQEYPLMREAIGQLMTGCHLTDEMIPVVAVPYSEKSHELAVKWSAYKQIQQLGIKFYLVKEDGGIFII